MNEGCDKKMVRLMRNKGNDDLNCERAESSRVGDGIFDEGVFFGCVLEDVVSEVADFILFSLQLQPHSSRWFERSSFSSYQIVRKNLCWAFNAAFIIWHPYVVTPTTQLLTLFRSTTVLILIRGLMLMHFDVSPLCVCVLNNAVCVWRSFVESIALLNDLVENLRSFFFMNKFFRVVRYLLIHQRVLTYLLYLTESFIKDCWSNFHGNACRCAWQIVRFGFFFICRIFYDSAFLSGYSHFTHFY